MDLLQFFPAMAEAYAEQALLAYELRHWQDAADSAQQALQRLPVTHPRSMEIHGCNAILEDAAMRGVSPIATMAQDAVDAAYTRRRQGLSSRLQALQV